MITGTTESGFCFEIPEENLDDWSLLKLLRRLDEGQSQLIVDITERLLGAEQQEKLEAFLAERNGGRVPASAMVQEVMAIFAATKAGKN